MYEDYRVIAGHKTSVSLESAFGSIKESSWTTHDGVGIRCRGLIPKAHGNLSSAFRCSYSILSRSALTTERA